jgi:hypothetical protein
LGFEKVDMMGLEKDDLMDMKKVARRDDDLVV